MNPLGVSPRSFWCLSSPRSLHRELWRTCITIFLVYMQLG
jgi:hypothetical protein